MLSRAPCLSGRFRCRLIAWLALLPLLLAVPREPALSHGFALAGAPTGEGEGGEPIDVELDDDVDCDDEVGRAASSLGRVRRARKVAEREGHELRRQHEPLVRPHALLAPPVIKFRLSVPRIVFSPDDPDAAARA